MELGQVWAISPAGIDEYLELYRIEVNEGPGLGVKILNKPVPQAFLESVICAEQNLYSRFMQLVGDKDPQHHEFTVQLRAFDVSKSGAKLGMPSLVALCTSLLRRSVRSGLIIVGEIALGGSIEPIHKQGYSALIAKLTPAFREKTTYQTEAICEQFLVDFRHVPAWQVSVNTIHEGCIISNFRRHGTEEVTDTLLMLNADFKKRV